LFIEDAVLLLSQVGAEEAVSASLEFSGKRGVPGVFAMIEEEGVIAVLGEEALVAELAFIEPETIETVAILRGVRTVEAVLFVVAPEGQVAVLVGEGVVAEFAVLGLLVDDGKPGDSGEEFLQLFKE